MKTLLVKTPEGKGYYLSQQKPPVYVTGRPFVVKNNSQVQLASARNCLVILGETELNDEEFLTAYEKEPAKAVKDAILDTEDADPEATKKAAAEAKKAAAEKAKLEKEEKARIKAEADAKAAEEARIKAEAKED